MPWWALFDGESVLSGPQGLPGGDDWTEVDLDPVPDGYTAQWDFSGSRPRRVAVPPSLEAAKKHAVNDIDSAAEQARNRYLTAGSGQAMEYEAAYQEALRYVSAQGGAYPMLAADVAAGLSPDLETTAGTVIAMRQQWEQVGAAIRQMRLAGKQAVNAAQTQSEVAAARDTAIASLDML